MREASATSRVRFYEEKGLDYLSILIYTTFIERPETGVFMFIRSHNYQQIQFQDQLQELARQMRRNPTLAEAELWKHLRARKLYGIKFRRQHPFFSFILDFYCKEYKLIIEIDGDSHANRFVHDMLRDQRFQQEGYTILRFTNEDVLYSIQTVLKKITHTVDILKPSPKRGEGSPEGTG